MSSDIKDSINEDIKEVEDSNLESNLEDSSDVDSSLDSNNTESSEIDNLKAKVKELEERYLRTHADFENVKKRLEREKSQALEYANEKILKDILPVIDTLDMALESAKSLENGGKIAEGLKHTLDNLHKALSKHGVERIESHDEFDPNIHNAVMNVANPDKEDNAIAQVLQNGYKYKDRILRPAMVSIVKNG